MQHIPKNLKYLYVCFSLAFIGYGMLTLITQEISASGKGIFGSAWRLQGIPAMVFGGVITLAGIYLLISIYYPNKKISKRRKKK